MVKSNTAKAGEAMSEVRRFTRTREEIDTHGHPYEVDELCVLASDYDALAARVQEVERERDEFKDQCKCMYCGSHHFNISICSKCTFTKPAAEPFKIKNLEQQLAEAQGTIERLRHFETLSDENYRMYEMVINQREALVQQVARLTQENKGLKYKSQIPWRKE